MFTFKKPAAALAAAALAIGASFAAAPAAGAQDIDDVEGPGPIMITKEMLSDPSTLTVKRKSDGTFTASFDNKSGKNLYTCYVIVAEKTKVQQLDKLFHEYVASPTNDIPTSGPEFSVMYARGILTNIKDAEVGMPTNELRSIPGNESTAEGWGAFAACTGRNDLMDQKPKDFIEFAYPNSAPAPNPGNSGTPKPPNRSPLGSLGSGSTGSLTGSLG